MELKNALRVLLYDQFNVNPDLAESDNDDTFNESIIMALVEKNEKDCPFKKYDCLAYCKNSVEDCKKGILINCDKKPEVAWREFIVIEVD